MSETIGVMSNRAARADIDVFDALPRPAWAESRWSPLHPGVGIQAEDVWDHAAVREAERLLARTERGESRTPLPYLAACVRVSRDLRGGPLGVDIGRALAEAISAALPELDRLEREASK